MQMLYISVNGDGAGDHIGNAIVADDHEGLKKVTGGLRQAHKLIEDYVTQMGGEIVTYAGDDGIYSIPMNNYNIDELENVRSQYAKASGISATMGIGESLSEAAKALIYGKINGKDQVVEYEPQIDDFIHEEGLEDELPDEALEEEDDDGFIDGDSDDEFVDDLGVDGDTDADGDIDGEDAVNLADEDEDGDIDGDDALEESGEEFSDIPLEEGSEEGELEDESLGDIDDQQSTDDQPMHEQSMSPEEDFNHDAIENQEDELDSDNIEADEEGGDSISDMIYANMGEGEGEEDFADESDVMNSDPSMEGEMPPEEGMSPEEGVPAEGGDLKSKVAQVLAAFKDGKQTLEMLAEQDPEFYNNTINMLDTMIEMARELNESPEDMMGEEMVDDIEDEAEFEGEPEEDDELSEEGISSEAPAPVEDGDSEEESEEEEGEEEEDKPKPFGKSETKINFIKRKNKEKEQGKKNKGSVDKFLKETSKKK